MLDPRAIGKLVLAADWTVAGSLKQAQPADIAAAIESYENVPALIDVDPRFASEDAEEVRNALKAIGMAQWPEMAASARTEWLNGTLLSLSDIPAKTLRSAARQAIHRDFRFANEVKPAIREIAVQIAERHKLALHRMKMMRDEIIRAQTQPQIEEQPHEWTQPEVDEANRLFRKLGLSTRYLLNGNDVTAFEEKPTEQLDERDEAADRA